MILVTTHTVYTPNSFIAIQNRLESKYVFSTESKTGYKNGIQKQKRW